MTETEIDYSKTNRMPLCDDCVAAVTADFPHYWRVAMATEPCESPSCASQTTCTGRLAWREQSWGCGAVLGDFDSGDGVRFTLQNMPTCYRRGPWCLQIEVAGGPKHHLWGCFDEADQPTRYYHGRQCAIAEAEAIAEVLWADRIAMGPVGSHTE